LSLAVLLFAASPAAQATAISGGEAPRRIAITIDDLPFVSYGAPLGEAEAATQKLLAALQADGVKAIGFVNEDKLQVRGQRDRSVALLEAWLDAGMELGNHGYGHLGFTRTPLAQYQEAVLKGEVVTRELLVARGRAPRYYRHPFTQTGPTAEAKAAFEAFLDAHGYRVAPFTVEHDDFVFARVYADALRARDAALASRVREAYLAHLQPALDTFESMSQDVFGREIAQILLIHASQLSADTLAAMLAAMKARGYAFVSLDEALADPAYASPDGYIGPVGPSWLRRFSLGLGRRTRKGGQPDPPQWIQALSDGRTQPPVK
jgi:peptidoglycan/xylan/chitin deacetylase (PgdA/CDA1 family)